MSNAETQRRVAAEGVFHAFLERQRTESELDLMAFLARRSEPLEEDVRREVRAIAEDYELLRGRLSGDASGNTPGREVGDYRLLRMIGAGGAGSVWEAMQISLGRRVALKILHPHLTLSDRTVERFHREAETGGRLQHPALVTVYAVGRADGLHFIAQELVGDGATLASYFARLRELKELPHDYYRTTAERFAILADGLHVAHEAGVVHRDVKPGNILLGDDGRPMLADFGLAKLADQLSLSRTGELAGTPFYLSPEQATGGSRDVDARSDVFSLGVTLYEALTLQRPFQGDSSQQVLRLIALEEPPDPCRLRSRVPRELALICGKAMEKATGRRYATTRDFARDLRRWLHDEPITARASLPHERAWKWALRHRVWSVALGLGFVAFVVVGALLLYNRSLWIEAEQHNADLLRFLTATRQAQQYMDPLRVHLRGSEPPPCFVDLVESARSALANDPIGLADHLASIGQRYRDLGFYLKAKPLLGEAVELFTTHLGPAHASTLDAQFRHADVLEKLFETKAATEVLRSMLDAMGDGEGPTDAHLADVLAHLHAICLKQQNRKGLSALESRYGSMEERLDETIKDLTAKVEDPPERYHLMGHLSWLHVKTKQFDLAHPLAAEARAGLERSLGPDHPLTLDVLERELAILAWLGDHERTRELGKELERRAERSAGPTNPYVARVNAAMGQVFRECGDLDEAVACYERALQRMGDALPDNHASRITTRTNYGITLGRAGRLAQASFVLGDTIKDKQAAFGPDHSSVFFSMRALAEVLEWAGRPDDARDLLEQARDGSLRTHGAKHRDTLAAKGALAVHHGRQGRLEDARALLSETITTREGMKLDFHFGHCLNLVEVLLDLGELPLAEAELAAGEAHSEEMTNPRRNEELRLRFACLRSKLLRLQGRHDEALIAVGKADPLVFRSFSDAGRHVLEGQRLVEAAHVHAARGDPATARAHLTTALDALADAPWLGHVRREAETLLRTLPE